MKLPQLASNLTFLSALEAIDRYGPEDHGGMPEISRDLLVLSKLNFKAGTSLSDLEFPTAASLWRPSDRPGVRWLRKATKRP